MVKSILLKIFKNNIVSESNECDMAQEVKREVDEAMLKNFSIVLGFGSEVVQGITYIEKSG